jgi:hypothetical protein
MAALPEVADGQTLDDAPPAQPLGVGKTEQVGLAVPLAAAGAQTDRQQPQALRRTDSSCRRSDGQTAAAGAQTDRQQDRLEEHARTGESDHGADCLSSSAAMSSPGDGGARRRMSRQTDAVRVGTWNLRHFTFTGGAVQQVGDR